MNCRDVEACISAYTDNELTKEEEKEIREHLGKCKSCRTYYEFEVASKKTIASMTKVKAPEGLREKIIAGIKNKSYESRESILPTFFFRSNSVFAAAAGIILLLGIFITVYYIYGSNKISPFISTALAYYENKNPEEITGTNEEIEKDFEDYIHRNIPIPSLESMGFELIGATHLPKISEKPCAALKYKERNGEVISHLVICCTKVPIEKLDVIKGKEEYYFANKDGLNIIFWRCHTTRTTRCIAGNSSIEKLVAIADEFRSASAERYKIIIQD